MSGSHFFLIKLTSHETTVFNSLKTHREDKGGIIMYAKKFLDIIGIRIENINHETAY